MKTKFIPRVYSNDQATLYLHITGQGIRKRVNLDIQISKKDWSQKNQRLIISSKVPENEQKKNQDLNLILENVDAKIINIKTVYRLTEQVLTPEKLADELINNLPRVNFCSFFQHVLDEEKERVTLGTHKRMKSVLKKIKTYNEYLIFTDLNINWFENYKNHLYKIGNQKTTINANIKAIKKILRLAIRSGIKIPVNIDDIKAGSTSGSKVSLEQQEIKLLYKYHESEFIYDSHRLILGYFLFSCVTGLRYSDVIAINRKSVADDFIQFKSQKTQKIQIIKLNAAAKKLIQVNERLFVDTFENQYINRELKIIARNLGIKKKVTFHISRHTFATSFLRAGGKVEKLQQLLGHSDIRTSMIYSHIVADEANKEMYLLDNLF
ncbi:MAG: site-specific integrase [Flavobacteriales bacterium]|nr:site-specific integrase [Flavobacteriales bacterium]